MQRRGLTKMTRPPGGVSPWPWLAVDVYDSFVPMNFTVADLQIEVAIWARTNPGLVVHSGTLATEI